MKFKLLFLGLLFTFHGQAQNCLENLFKANKLLESGKADECIAISNACSGIENEESVRWQAYRLKSIAFLALGNPDSARVNAENMLELNPTYKPNLLKDSRDFVNLLGKVVVIPKFSIGLAISIGSNTTFPQIGNSYVVSDYSKTYSAGNSFQFGTYMGLNLSPNLELNMGVLATSKKYAIDYAFAGWEVNVKEQLTYLDIPVNAKFIFFPQNKFRFFLQGGCYGGYLLYSSNDFTSTYQPNGEVYSLTQLNSLDRRNRFNFGLNGGLGMYYKIKPGHLSFQAIYYYSFKQINIPENRYNYPEQIYTYFYVDDDITLHNLALSVGYTHYLNYKVYRNKK